MYIHKVIEAVLGNIKDIIFTKLLNSFTGPVEKNEKVLFNELTNHMEELIQLFPTEQHVKNLERFYLDIGIKGFESNNLERRLRGLKMINRSVKRAMGKEEKEKRLLQFLLRVGVPLRQNQLASQQQQQSSQLTGSGYMPGGMQQQDERREKSKPLDPKFILDWLKESEFLTKLFHKNSHPEEVKQGILIAKFLACNTELSNETIEQLWLMSLGKHESVKNTIYDALIDLTEDLSVPQIDYLQSLMEALKNKDHDMETLRFISNFTPLAIEKDSTHKNWYGMDLFYQLSLDDSQVSENIASTAFDYLIQLLKLDIVAPRRMYYAEKAIDNISSSFSSPQSFVLLREILLTIPKRKRIRPIRKDVRLSTIEVLHQRHHLIDITLADLENYKSKLTDSDKRAIAIGTSPLPLSSSPSSSCFLSLLFFISLLPSSLVLLPTYLPTYLFFFLSLLFFCVEWECMS